MKIWIDITSLPHVQFFRALIKRLEKKGNKVLVTSRKFDIMNNMLTEYGIDYKTIGEHGGKDIETKLIRSSERTGKLTELIAKEKPDVGISKHSVECARVCFGLNIPSIMVIDHETAEPAMRLMVPLTDYIILPKATPVETIEKFGSRDIVKFEGVCEVAHFFDYEPDDKVLHQLGIKATDDIIIARSEPMLSSHNDHHSVLHDVLRKIKNEYRNSKIVFIPRSEDDMKNFNDLDLITPKKPIDTLSLYHFAKLMIGAGSCMNREACIGGCPTISICPDNLPAVDKYLIEKKIMFHSLKSEDIINLSKKIIEDTSFKQRNGNAIKGFEDPYEKIFSILRNFQ